MTSQLLRQKHHLRPSEKTKSESGSESGSGDEPTLLRLNGDDCGDCM
jgi:hypothetical protein